MKELSHSVLSRETRDNLSHIGVFNRGVNGKYVNQEAVLNEPVFRDRESMDAQSAVHLLRTVPAP